MSTGYPKTEQPCTIHGVMPSYLQEVEKECYTMIQKYGKKRAEEEAILIAESYIEDINNLEYYNAEKIDLWDKRKFFGLKSQCVSVIAPNVSVIYDVADFQQKAQYEEPKFEFKINI